MKDSDLRMFCFKFFLRVLLPLVFFLIIVFQPSLYSSNLELILLTSDKGLLVSEDGGSSWKGFNHGLSYGLVPLKILSGESGSLYLLTDSSGIFRFNRIKNIWEDINSGLFLAPSFLAKTAEYRDISAFSVLDRGYGEELILATRHSVFRKRKDSAWKRISVFSQERYYTAFAFGQDGFIYAGTSCNGLFVYYKTGLKNISGNLPGEAYSKDRFFYEEISKIATGETPGTIYAGLNFGGGVYSSTDNGRSWGSLKLPIASGSFYDIHDLKVCNDSLFVSTEKGIYRMDRSRKWYLVYSDNFLNLAMNKSNLSVLIINKSGAAPPLFYRLNEFIPGKNRDLISKPGNRKAIYVNSYSINRNLFSYIETIKKCGLNSIVMDMKDDWGDICFNTRNKTAHEIGAVKKYVDVERVIKVLKKNDIYAIARIVVFKDKRIYQAFNSKYAIWDKKKNEPWKGNAREYWNDPYSDFVRNYNIEIAVELREAGFDEVQFDYIRFPSDGPIDRCFYRFKKDTDVYKSEILEYFLREAKDRIDIPLSVDIYGFNTWFRFGNIIGQDAGRFARIVDVLCPMIYPSHYGREFFARFKGNERPYRIVLDNSIRAWKITMGNSVLRPYIQAFNYLSPGWGPDYIRAQVKAVSDSGCNGYTFWNAGGKYGMVEKAMSINHK